MEYSVGQKLALPELLIDSDGFYEDYENCPIEFEVEAQEVEILRTAKWNGIVLVYVSPKIHNWPDVPADLALCFSADEIESGFANYLPPSKG